jgi:hypothetical protein
MCSSQRRRRLARNTPRTACLRYAAQRLRVCHEHSLHAHLPESTQGAEPKRRRRVDASAAGRSAKRRRPTCTVPRSTKRAQIPKSANRWTDRSRPRCGCASCGDRPAGRSLTVSRLLTTQQRRLSRAYSAPAPYVFPHKYASDVAGTRICR